MRAFKRIKSEISDLEHRIESLKIKKEGLAFSDAYDGHGKAIVAFIASLFAGVIALITKSVMRNSLDFKMPIAIWLFYGLFLFVAFLQVISYYKSKLKISQALRMIILSSIICIFCGIDILNNLEVKSIFNALFVKYEDIIVNKIGTNIASIDRGILYSNIALTATAVLVLIGSIVKFVKGIKKKNADIRKESELEQQIELCKNTIDELYSELENSKTEANRLFNIEIKKEKPDLKVINELANIGLDSAKKWLADEKKATNLIEGNQIFNEEVKKEKPDLNVMKKALTLGVFDAGLWIAKHMAVSCLSDYDNYADREIQSIFTDVGDYVNKSFDCSDKNTLIVLDVLAKELNGKKAYPSADELDHALQILRDMKKLDAPTYEEKILSDKALAIIISASNAGKVSKKKKVNADDFEKRFDISEWDEDYVYDNTAFCVAWCNNINDDIRECLKQGEYRKAKELFLDIIDGIDYLQEVANSTHLDYISAITYLQAAGLDICKGNEWYNDEDRRELSIQACLISGKYDFEASEAAITAADLLSQGVSFEELQSVVFPHFPNEIINKLALLDEPYENLWKELMK